jgi:hypothetical protein
MTLLTPLGALAALAAPAVAGAMLLGGRRAGLVRRRLGLPAPHRRSPRNALAAGGVMLLGLAAAQPALTRTSHLRIRSDAEAVFVLDTSRSMAAASSPGAPTRLDRAVAEAVRLRNAIPDVPAGILTLTDRVLPDLLPVADRKGFAAVAERAVRIESPPPRSTLVRATSFGALAGIDSGNVFAPSAARRIVVLLTDGESNPVQTADLARALPARRGYRFLAVRFWRADESVFDADGRREAAYRPDPSAGPTLTDVATALGGRSYDEASARDASSYLRALADRGPMARAGGAERRRVTLAPDLGLAGLAVLLAALLPSVSVPSGLRLSRQ